MPMSLPPNRNIINKLKTKRTQSELPDESKLTEVLFMMDQFSRDTVFIILSLKVRKKKLRVQLAVLLLSLTLKKLLPRKQSSPLSPLRDNSSKKATPMSLLPNRNIINKLKTKRTQSEPLEESKPTVASSTIHQFSADTVSITPFPKVKEKQKPKKTLLLNTLLPNPTNKRKNLLNKSSRLSKSKETSKWTVTPALPLPKKNIIKNLRTRRTPSELLEELWLTEVWFINHQWLPDMKIQLFQGKQVHLDLLLLKHL